jgi:hypothetical protein
MAVSKVILNGDTLMDVTQDSVTAPTLLSGETATGADGVRVTGTATVPTPSTTTPSMDGTAAAGTSTDYARADHVHPTDTSRAAASHTHAITDVTNLQSALDAKQDALVSGTNIKTINGTSLLGSGNISTAELPAVTAADNGKVLMVVGGVWQVASLPIASDNAFGVVKVDGTTITATDGVISTAGGAETYEVTITLTNPSSGQYFEKCNIYGYDTTAKETTVLLGEIDSPTGSATVEYDPSLHEKLGIQFSANWGATYDAQNITCTGDVSFYDFDISNVSIFNVEGDGTITFDGIDYGD